MVNALDQRRGGADDNEAQAGHLIAYRKATKAHDPDDWERWEQASAVDTIAGHGTTTATAIVGEPTAFGADDLLPLGLDSHRYRCCGNGVVSSVAEWIGLRLLALLDPARP